jgi:hypothetical protein
VTTLSLAVLLVVLAASALVAASEHPQDDRGLLAAGLRLCGWLSILRHRDGPGGLLRLPGRLQPWWEPGRARWIDDANAEIAAVSVVCVPVLVILFASLLSGCESFVAASRIANSYHAAAEAAEERVDDEVETLLVRACRKASKQASDAARAAQDALLAEAPAAKAAGAVADRAAARMRKVCAFAHVEPGMPPKAPDMAPSAPDAAPAPVPPPTPPVPDARPVARDGGP